MTDFTGFWDELYSGLRSIAKRTMTDVSTEAITLGERLFTKAKEDIEKWTIQLAAGMLTTEEFSSLMEGQKDWFEMEALKIEGIAKAKANELFAEITSLIISSAVKMLL